MDRVHLVFQFIGPDEITMEVCRQRGSPRTEPRLTSSMGRWGDREEPAKGLLPDKWEERARRAWLQEAG